MPVVEIRVSGEVIVASLPRLRVWAEYVGNNRPPPPSEGAVTAEYKLTVSIPVEIETGSMRVFVGADDNLAPIAPEVITSPDDMPDTVDDSHNTDG